MVAHVAIPNKTPGLTGVGRILPAQSCGLSCWRGLPAVSDSACLLLQRQHWPVFGEPLCQAMGAACEPLAQLELACADAFFEVRLRNELKQKAVARECAQWMRRKAKFRSNTTRDSMNNFMLVSDGDETYAYSPMNSFTTVDLGCERGNNMTNIVVRVESPESTQFLQTFNQVWNDKERPSQPRGVPFLAPVLEPLKQVARLTDAELMASVLSSMNFCQTSSAKTKRAFSPPENRAVASLTLSPWKPKPPR